MNYVLTVMLCFMGEPCRFIEPQQKYFPTLQACRAKVQEVIRLHHLAARCDRAADMPPRPGSTTPTPSR